MDGKVKFYRFLTLALTVSGVLTAIVYSRNEAVIYFWECTAAVRVCNLQNAIIFFALSTIAVMGLLYFVDALPAVVNKKARKLKVQQTTSPQEVVKPDPLIQRFSFHLDESVKELKKNPKFQMTGNGRSFLRRIKNAPPFLGRASTNPVIYPNAEIILEQVFRAQEIIEKNKESIRGGYRYTVTNKDTTWKIISKKHYGSVKYANHLREKYPTYTEPKTGLVVDLPYIDTSGNLEEIHIQNQFDISSDDRFTRTVIDIINEQVISPEEALYLLYAIYAAAQKALEEER